MGYPMAGHLAAAPELEVTVHNRTASRAERWASEHDGRVAGSLGEAARDADVVMTCVGNDDDVRAVVLGPGGVLAGLREGAVLVDHTTASAELARELHGACADAGVGFVDAPVSGGQSGAENGVLTVMCGGEPEVFARVEPVMQHYARAVTLLGPPGSGQLTKMVNQVCIAGILQGLSEGLAFGARAGLDMDQVIEVISQGAAGSWQMQNRGPTMVRGEFDFGFALDWMHKDLAIVLAEADRNGAHLPVTALVDQLYRRLQRQGHGRWDTSALVTLLED
jgi:3-hydroxyisobutyrate dehydrogenase-like beta-hydroxyacid dehydrogenase